MLDRFVIFTKTGVILWSWTLLNPSNETLRTSTESVSALVREILLPERHALTVEAHSDVPMFEWNSLALKYLVANAQDIVFCAVFDLTIYRGGKAPYADNLVKGVRAAFLSQYGEKFTSLGTPFVSPEARAALGPTQAPTLIGASVLLTEDASALEEFETAFLDILNTVENQKPTRIGANKQIDSANSLEASENDAVESEEPDSKDPSSDANLEDDDEGDAGDTPSRLTGLAAIRARNLAKRPARGRAVRTALGGVAKFKEKKQEAGNGKGKAKEERIWSDKFEYNERAADALDKSRDKDMKQGAAEVEKVVYSGTGASGSGKDFDDSNADADLSKGSWMKSVGGKIGGWLQGVAGSKELTEEDLEPILKTLRSQLIERNVASEVAEELISSMNTRLVGTKVEGGFTFSPGSRVYTLVVDTLTESIQKILTPRTPIELLRDVKAKAKAGAKGRKLPYVVVLCGVNGVGKSTSLSKLAFHLKDHGHSVLIAACDSFRSGAVEQLRRHCTALDVPLFEQGYAKDPIDIAARAIKQAEDDGVDVVLIDTAGRMQNNSQLMAQLAKLVAVNSPDLVLFVGEALVGNDGVDQLMEFDRALVDLAVDRRSPRRIDGIILTKFDTVDDKVGTTLSMVYKTGIPIAFIGTGQHYPDLRRLNTAAVVKALLV